ncbi:hypothetical protein TOPH_06627 [Tolypocladium ophioglossoides CBS 100239]|uniref:Uncharacterized protein n=1 Tax=Tolypocladium ophioglossoides (strain CBS 100239) TaxID=1163406 RepID=A0A0L0N4H0_TOLOC|nr:hypothetical protein TOPH_06627 [Tolypocladium ophioglossoides CBS 100239]
MHINTTRVFPRQGDPRSLQALAPDEREEDAGRLPQDEHRVNDGERELERAERPAAHDGARVEPDGDKGDGEEVVREDGGLLQDAAEQGAGPVRHATLEVLEAVELEGAQLAVVCGEERVEGLSEDVDDGGEGLAAPIEGDDGGADGARVLEVADAGRVNELGEEEGIVEGDGHAAAGEGVAHVEGVTEEDDAVGRREPAVGHAARDLAIVEGALGRGADAGGQRGYGHVLDVPTDAAGRGRGLGDALRDVEQGACLAGADLVEQDGGGVADDDVAKVLLRQRAVDELEGVELALHDGLVAEDLLAELGVVAVGNDSQVAKEVVALLLARLPVDSRPGLDAENLVRVLAANGVEHLRLDNGDVLVR